MVLNAALSRRLALLFLLVLLGFWRAEQGVAELQGRQGEPSRVFRLVPGGDGYWSYAILGLEGRVPGEILIYHRGQALLTNSDLPEVAAILSRVQTGLAAQLARVRLALP